MLLLLKIILAVNILIMLLITTADFFGNSKKPAVDL